MAAAPRQSPSAHVPRGAGHGCVIAFAVLYGVGFGVFDCLAPSVCLTWPVQCALSGMGCGGRCTWWSIW